MSANNWNGIELPKGLTPDRASAAAKLINDYEGVDLSGDPHQEVMNCGELVLKLFAVLCGPPDSPSS